MNKEKMIRKQIYLEAGQNEIIKRISAAKGKTEAEIVRDALSEYFITEKKHIEDPLTELIGMVHNANTDGSVNHDELVYLRDQKEGTDEK